ncbi:hypothetical protein RHEC894_PE00514 (plasmid) [Rhizobium sp. CIAT894]|nr:hypothetical protein RHEC894_PE00514 [Rhizobium sp. CIAT894]
MPHGVAPISCPRSSRNARIRVESTPCTMSTKFKPDSSGPDPGIHSQAHGLNNLSAVGRHLFPHSTSRMDPRVKPWDDGEWGGCWSKDSDE